ncbi:MAG: alpha/beta hydrolase [Chloroflexi bacterium]|nr:alpha/beta hydrolase [Chloroflexota bacterium]
MLQRARARRNPFYAAPFDEVAPAIEGLASLDRAAWAQAFSTLARPHERRCAEAEARGDEQTATEAAFLAYTYYAIARYPLPAGEGQWQAYRRAQAWYLRATRTLDPPLERVEIPCDGEPGRGSAIVGYLRRPRGQSRPPLLLMCAGLDVYKEEHRADAFLAAGLATFAMDMPGTGDAPIVGSETAERLWDAVFAWVASRPDLDASRVALMGTSTGGYWAAKVAHTHRDHLRAVVSQGGCAHVAFTREWIEQAEQGEYPFDLALSLARAFGLSSAEAWWETASRFSLLELGVLDQPCAPLLLVNGLQDTVFPIADLHLLLQHGSPKSARIFPVGHMGNTPETLPMILSWLQSRLA